MPSDVRRAVIAAIRGVAFVVVVTVACAVATPAHAQGSGDEGASVIPDLDWSAEWTKLVSDMDLPVARVSLKDDDEVWSDWYEVRVTEQKVGFIHRTEYRPVRTSSGDIVVHREQLFTVRGGRELNYGREILYFHAADGTPLGAALREVSPSTAQAEAFRRHGWVRLADGAAAGAMTMTDAEGEVQVTDLALDLDVERPPHLMYPGFLAASVERIWRDGEQAGFKALPQDDAVELNVLAFDDGVTVESLRLTRGRRARRESDDRTIHLFTVRVEGGLRTLPLSDVPASVRPAVTWEVELRPEGADEELPDPSRLGTDDDDAGEDDEPLPEDQLVAVVLRETGILPSYGDWTVERKAESVATQPPPFVYEPGGRMDPFSGVLNQGGVEPVRRPDGPRRREDVGPADVPALPMTEQVAIVSRASELREDMRSTLRKDIEAFNDAWDRLRSLFEARGAGVQDPANRQDLQAIMVDAEEMVTAWNQARIDQILRQVRTEATVARAEYEQARRLRSAADRRDELQRILGEVRAQAKSLEGLEPEEEDQRVSRDVLQEELSTPSDRLQAAVDFLSLGVEVTGAIEGTAVKEIVLIAGGAHAEPGEEVPGFTGLVFLRFEEGLAVFRYKGAEVTLPMPQPGTDGR